MKLSLLLLTLSFFSCKKEEEKPYLDKAQLTCYAGEKVIYQITTQTYKISHPSQGTNDDTWEIDTDKGKTIITGNCIYKPLNF